MLNSNKTMAGSFTSSCCVTEKPILLPHTPVLATQALRLPAGLARGGVFGATAEVVWYQKKKRFFQRPGVRKMAAAHPLCLLFYKHSRSAAALSSPRSAQLSCSNRGQ
jgi:hypothetical protein